MGISSKKIFPVIASGKALSQVMPLLSAAEAVCDIVSNMDAIFTTWEMAESHRHLCESDRRDLAEIRRMIIKMGENMSDPDLNLCLRTYRQRVVQAREDAQRRIRVIGRRI